MNDNKVKELTDHNKEVLKKMYEVFKNYDVEDSSNINEVNDKFLEMMSDYKNFNKLMNSVFALNETVVNDDTPIEDKRIVYNIKKFGAMYENIYRNYLNCFINEADEFNPSLNSHKQAYNSFVRWYDKQLSSMNKEELLDMLKDICNEIENDTLDVIK